jgi:predicted regulator of Ras-like GTPase activity (Roadblock/LC7/MglB family)
MLAWMDAEQAIGDLTEISPQVRDVIVVGADGSVTGSNTSPERAAAIADGARRLLEAADETHGREVAQLEAATGAGSVFVVRDGGRVIAATTTPEPTVGLVFYDLKTCLRSIDEPKPPRRRTTRKKPEGDGAA